MPTRRVSVSLAAVLGGLSLMGAGGAFAAQTDPAAVRIESFDSSLLEVMKGGSTLGAKGRFHKLAPVVDATFDIPLMTRVAVGSTWTTMSEADRAALVKGFARLSAASYAHNFDAFGGERFTIEPKVDTRGLDKIVQSHIVPAKGAPTALTYRMRSGPEGWKIVDVYYGAISQLATRRSDFAAPLAAGGAKGLVAHLDALTEKLLK